MADPVTAIMNYLSNGNIIGIPVPFFIFVIAIIIFVIYLLLTRRPKQKEYKAIDLRKQIKKDFNTLYGMFGESVGKKLYHGITPIGHIKGFIPVVWNKNISIKDNLVANKFQQVKDAMLGTSTEVIMDDPTTIKKDKKIVKVPVTMKALKVSRSNFLLRLLGVGTRYHVVEDSLIMQSDIGWVIDSHSQPAIFFDTIFYNQPARNYVEDVSFRINRENELTEIANAVPRVVFWDNEFAKRAMSMREAAEIEKERFKGQKENAED